MVSVFPLRNVKSVKKRQKTSIIVWFFIYGRMLLTTYMLKTIQYFAYSLLYAHAIHL